jgi:hypothetical protein
VRLPELKRPGLNLPSAGLAIVAAAQVVTVAIVAATEPTDGALAVVVALVLAAPGVWAVEGIATRVAGPRFGLAAAVLYVLVPSYGHHFFADTPQIALRAGYHRNVLPFLDGTRAPAWFALGIGLAVLLRLGATRVVGIAGVVAAVVAAVLWVNGPWTALYGNFHETTWSPTLVCVLPFACALGIGLRSPWVAAALGGWLAFFVLRAVHHPYYDSNGGFWSALAAAMPAIAVLISGLVLLVPRLWPKQAADPSRPERSQAQAGAH